MGEVQREAENGRLLRLLMKLNYICERPELGGDSQWAETGDRWVVTGCRRAAAHRTPRFENCVVSSVLLDLRCACVLHHDSPHVQA
jgi:PAB-dependent poly(A)-specific ribonuclease subunit 3